MNISDSENPEVEIQS